jgi:hypothetical protein
VGNGSPPAVTATSLSCGTQKERRSQAGTDCDTRERSKKKQILFFDKKHFKKGSQKDRKYNSVKVRELDG